jgi:uncharacterized protein (TIGR02246 family)
VNEAAVSSLVAELEAAWNAHDMSRFSSHFATDASFVSALGAWWRSRDEIEHKLAGQHAGRFKFSTMRLELAATEEIVPGVAILHVAWQIDGHDRSGPRATTGTRTGIWTWVVRDRGGKVEIVAAHNTDVLTPSPGSTAVVEA